MSFGTLYIGEHGATRPVRLVTSSLWVFQPSPFCSPFLGAPRGMAITKILISPSGATVSPGVCTPAVDRSVNMHGLRRESISQLCCGSGIQIMINGWPLFDRITGRSRFNCLRGLYVFFWIQIFSSFMIYFRSSVF